MNNSRITASFYILYQRMVVQPLEIAAPTGLLSLGFWGVGGVSMGYLLS